MSRIGKQFIAIPEKVKVKLDGQKVSVDGPKGSLSRILPSLICCSLDEENQKIFIEKRRIQSYPEHYGLSRTLVANMVTGVSVGFEKRLQITGVGYRVQLDGKDLVLNMGYSHPVKMVTPSELAVKVESPTSVLVSGMQRTWLENLLPRYVQSVRQSLTKEKVSLMKVKS